MEKNKRVFLYVSGDDYAAMDFDKRYSAQEVYEMMVAVGKTFHSYEDEHNYYEIKIYEFDYVCDSFIGFIRDKIMDYDQSKDADFFEVEPV